MKRLQVGLVLVALVLAVGVLAAAGPYPGDSNTTYVLNDAGTAGWLYVQNGGSAAASVIRLEVGAKVAVEGGYTTLWDGTYQYVVLPAALDTGKHVSLFLSGVNNSKIGLLGVTLGDYYSWLPVTAGSQGQITELSGGVVLYAGADGGVALFVQNGADASQFVRLVGSSDLAIGGNYKVFSDSKYTYVDLGSAVAGGAVVSLVLTAGSVSSAEIGYFGAVLSAVEASGASSILTVYNAGSQAATKLAIYGYTAMSAVIEGYTTVVPQLSNTILVVALPTPLVPGSSLTVQIDPYEGEPTSVKIFDVDLG